jgi:hypothetical protein
MYSRLVFRSIQHPVRSLILNRFLSLTQIQSIAATKLKEKISTNDEGLSTKMKVEKSNETISQDKIENPLSTSTNLLNLNKIYSEKIHQIVDEISKLSLVEVMDLNELLKVNSEIYLDNFIS